MSACWGEPCYGLRLEHGHVLVRGVSTWRMSLSTVGTSPAQRTSASTSAHLVRVLARIRVVASDYHVPVARCGRGPQPAAGPLLLATAPSASLRSPRNSAERPSLPSGRTTGDCPAATNSL